MDQLGSQQPFVVSPAIYALIATSPRLQQKLLPEGLFTTPYEVLDYQATLILHDPKGKRATFQRTEQIRFLQEGVAGIVDHAWGDGVVVTSYENNAGAIEESFRDAGHRHVVIGLKRPMHRGETLTFAVVRTALLGFTQADEWLETTIDHPITRMGCRIVFPKKRPCRRARVHVAGSEIALPVTNNERGHAQVRLDLERARPHTPYTIRWTW